jgi:hypothetical protein
MDAWEELPSHEYDRAWALFTATFRFRPSIHRADWPGVVEPTPSATYDISAAYDHDDPWLRPVRGELNLHVLKLLRAVVPPNGWLYAMDWHAGWRFYPHREFDARDVRAWGVSVLPHGDYTVFLTPDLRHGTFGHPWEGTVCVFGQSLLSLVRADKPALLGEVLRRDGIATQGSLS